MTTDVERLAELESKLSENIKSAHLEAQTPMSVVEIADIVHQIITTIAGDITVADLKFYSELRDLAQYIRKAKEEIAEIKPKDISEKHIYDATNELDAVVGATEEATNKIMDVCDQISAIANECGPEQSQKLVDCTTHIFEACNFQDITGQRITKVVQTLKYIDTKVEALLKALGEEIHRDGSFVSEQPEEVVDPDKTLLNGPQLPQNAIDQSEIDKLLGDF